MITHGWKQPLLAELKSDAGEFSIAITDPTDGNSWVEKIAGPKPDSAKSRRDELRRKGYLAFMFNRFGHLAS